jgi:hypothetical protein
MMDIEQARREAARWIILRILDAGRPIGVSDTIMARILEGERLPAARRELRRECDYLHGLGLIEVEDEDEGFFAARLTAAGIDVVEYASPAPAGIARPARTAEAR